MLQLRPGAAKYINKNKYLEKKKKNWAGYASAFALKKIGSELLFSVMKMKKTLFSCDICTALWSTYCIQTTHLK